MAVTEYRWLKRELCMDAKRAVREGSFPALEKQRAKRCLKEAESFGEFGAKKQESARATAIHVRDKSAVVQTSGMAPLPGR